MATVDLGKISFTQKGTWNSGTSYVAKDVVQYEDDRELSSYVAIASSTNQAPSTNGTVNTTYWALFAKGTSMASHNQGTYNGATSYQKGDIVEYTDSGVLSTYLAIADSTGQTPSTGGTVNSSYWQFIAKGTASVAISWQSTAKTANFTASAAEGYFVDTNGGSVTVTTPSSPSVGDEFIITDLRGSFATNICQIAGNGSDKIKGASGTFDIRENNANVRMVYSGSTYGWLVVTSGAVDAVPVTKSYNVQYLVVAAGGGGGGDNGGGGGAGGYRANASKDFEVIGGTTYTITVGTGGVGGHNDPVPSGGSGNPLGNNGGNSVFSTITSAGGGGGGSSGNSGVAGGSGGGGGQGGSGAAGNTPSVSPSQGNPGANGGPSGTGTGGGGGGAGASGSGTSGGNGTANSITGSSVTYAGGGGAGEDQNSSGNAGSGGSGGGGNGSNSGNGSNGTNGLGGGGGGGHQAGDAIGGTGGNGVVILRMLDADYSGTTTGSPTVTTGVGGTDTVIQFTSTGSYTA